jgi:hypothetical protein
LSIEIDLAESGINLKAIFKGRGAERANSSVPAPPCSLIGNNEATTNNGQKIGEMFFAQVPKGSSLERYRKRMITKNSLRLWEQIPN